MPAPLRCTLAELQVRGTGRLPGLIGVEVTGLDHSRITGRLAIRPELLAPNGFLHAASVIALADTLCGYATLAHLPEDARNFTTIELKSNFLGTAREGTIECQGSAVHLGRNTQVWDAVVSAAGKHIALFRCTQMVLR